MIVGIGDEGVERARREGAFRQKWVDKHGMRTKWTDRNDQTRAASEANHVEAAGAELAVSIALGLPWVGEHGDRWLRTPDVGGYEVRFTRVDPPGLIIRQRDLTRSPTSIYVLVSGVMPTYTLHGWASPDEVALERYFVPGEPPYWSMPAFALHDLRRLKMIAPVAVAKAPETFDDVPDEALV